MTTTITLNSLQRFNFDKNTAASANPFNFTIPQELTGNWSFKRRPFSRTALGKATDSFSVKVCRVFIPKNLVPVQQPILLLDIKPGQVPIIDKQILPKMKPENIYEGTTGECTPYSDLTTYGSVWTLYPACPDETPNHWVYDSCTDVSYNQDWKGVKIDVKIRDQFGYILSPPNAPANGITGFTGICLFETPRSVGTTGCKPKDKCCPTYAADLLAYKNSCHNKTVPLPDSVYFPFFRPENQVIIVLSSTYIENDAINLSECLDKQY